MFKNTVGITRRQFSSVATLLQEAKTGAGASVGASVGGDGAAGEKKTRRQNTNAIFLGDALEALATPPVEKANIARSFNKNFNIGATYDPFDFSMARLNLDKKRNKANTGRNGLDRKNLNPLDFYTNPRFLSSYVTSMGKIMHRDVTKLSPKNQKRVTVAIKRAINAGLMSPNHKDVSFLAHRHGNQ